MPKIFQSFNLDRKAMMQELTKLTDEESQKLNLPEAGEKLIQELKDMGYDVLTNFTTESGLPTVLIVAGEYPSDRFVKNDFPRIADKLGLRWYGSGDYFSKA